MLVPQGRLKVARRFNAGLGANECPSRGTVERFPSGVRCHFKRAQTARIYTVPLSKKNPEGRGPPGFIPIISAGLLTGYWSSST